jgi:hypothetical protein
MRLLLLPLLAVLALPAAAAQAKPAVCEAAAIQHALIAAGKLTQEDVDNGVGVDLVRCGDVTDDGTADAVFTLASGGTAGDTTFGVLRGATSPRLVLLKPGYKIGVARVSRRAFDVLEPHYGANDPNCCPSSFRRRRYTWTGRRFAAGRAVKLERAPRRFYRP